MFHHNLLPYQYVGAMALSPAPSTSTGGIPSVFGIPGISKTSTTPIGGFSPKTGQSTSTKTVTKTCSGPCSQYTSTLATSTKETSTSSSAEKTTVTTTVVSTTTAEGTTVTLVPTSSSSQKSSTSSAKSPSYSSTGEPTSSSQSASSISISSSSKTTTSGTTSTFVTTTKPPPPTSTTTLPPHETIYAPPKHFVCNRTYLGEPVKLWRQTGCWEWRVVYAGIMILAILPGIWVGRQGARAGFI